MLNVIRSLFFIVVAVTLLSCAASPTSESTGEYLDSSAVTAKVKANLLDQLGTKAFAIKVKTYKDEVQLSGFVDNQKIKQKAGLIAGKVPNVKRVINNIIVKG
ncbi:BON domain-containing protein [Legionella israelensis]|uniref:Putative periplasmic or secreted lipoprotein n=1 Tax=Legionella israelensis TaxID=454 RepID=A0A0W0WID6_9GAMM|nr:BON domain-containing protein [Legionella israelensis]KTD32046.1 putative periplasmic or secreted lipoprotein [Legionella israelensis]QBS09089.1 BON domain-containing protein [Legionella israelensis]SCY08949.1 BON domain-containing protein [Legionella israelensis DSM 19235]STX58808.1 putative periplasmic or secreted lipoprotein [Legionella israelensis]